MATQKEPAYVRIERHLWALLDEGAGVSEALPSEVDLAKQFGVSIMTVRQAYNSLVTAGAVVRKRFQGTWATTHITDDLGQISRRPYTEAWQAGEVTAEVLEFELRPSPAHVASRFSIEPGTPMSYLERVRHADQQSVAWDARWMPALVAERTAREEFAARPVFDIMADLGLRVTIMRSDITARLADAPHAQHLDVQRGDVLLVRQSTAVDEHECVQLLSTSLYPASRYTFRSQTNVDQYSSGEAFPRD